MALPSVQNLAADDAGSFQRSANIDFSGTNNQEGNVDEADLLKTDGSYIYTISANKLSIIRSYPVSNAKLLSTIDLSEFYPNALFLEGDYLAVFGTGYEYQKNCQPSIFSDQQIRASSIRIANPCPSYVYTNIRIYNVKNRSNPSLIKSYQIDGSYFNGRKTSNGWIYILSTQNLYQRENPFPWFNLGSEKVFLKKSSLFFYPFKYQNPRFLNIFSFNLGNPYARRNANLVSLIT